MKRNFLALALTLPFAASAAFAQTSTAPMGSADTGMTTGTFGSDWSMSLSQALFDTDGTTVRTEDELRTQWDSMSEEDKNMLRRDCMSYTEQSGGDASSSTAATGTTSGTGTTTDTTAGNAPSAGTTPSAPESATADTSTSGSDTAMNVTMAQMEEICAVVDEV